MSPSGTPGPGFDRLRPRTPHRPLTVVDAAPPPASRAASVLFSEPVPEPSDDGSTAAAGAAWRLVLRCGACGTATPLTTPGLVLRSAVPSVHLPWLALAGVRHTSWMRCPACARRTWVRLGLRTGTGPGGQPAGGLSGAEAARRAARR